MTLRTFRRIVLYTIVALVCVVVIAIVATLALGSGCRGEGCGWLLLVPIFWGSLLLPPLTAALLVGFGICSGFRFRDIGVNGIFGAIPALLALRAVTAIDDLVRYPLLLLRYPMLAANIISICCTLICLFLLFSKGTGYLAAARAAHSPAYRVTLIAAILLFVVGIPYAALDFGRSFGHGMFMYDELFDLRFLYDLTFRFAPMYYFYMLLQAVVAGGLWVLTRSAAGDAAPSAIDGRQ